MDLPANDPQTFELPSELLHELRTPLNAILGYSEMLIERTKGESPQDLADDLQKVHDAGTKLLGLMDTRLHPSGSGILHEEADPLPDSEMVPYSGLGPAPTGTERYLLVVDDNAANRDVLTQRLERDRFRVRCAESGAIALELVSADHCDLVLLDVMMGEMDGYEVLRRLKADEKLRNIPVIMISALNDLDSIARCIELGAEDYLPKPFNAVLLRARVNACLERKHAHDREMRLFAQLESNFKRLQELEKLRDDLTHMIIHDLRTPLTSVIAGMQSIDAVGDLNPDQQEMVAISVAGGETLLSMINDLLDVERSESDNMSLDYALLDPEELIESALIQITSLAENGQLKLIRQTPHHSTPFEGDEEKLRRTLVNLLGNAIKFTPEGGSVTIGSESLGETIRFFVTDTGEGIPREAYGQIFEKFGQVESRQGGRKMSTGLGLTFCKLAVEAHGGRILVESSPGEGSTFSFTIPKTPSVL